MNQNEKCCGTCEYHYHESIDDGYICVNDESENIADWTDFGDECSFWEEKKNKS